VLYDAAEKVGPLLVHAWPMVERVARELRVFRHMTGAHIEAMTPELAA
jgi:hypothetical protein